MTMTIPIPFLRRRLLHWYDRNLRSLPWRAPPGETTDPYRVWLSEIMLQQTGVTTVIPYFTAFLERWSRIEDLAAADLDQILHAWQGLGYYARARNLHKCAQEVTDRLGGRFPQSEADLIRLPGIGAYTAAAIAAIAFQQPATPVDGNVVRVLARLHGVTDALPGARRRLDVLASKMASAHRPGDFAQALMDLGATVCSPRAPSCDRCPWIKACLAHGAGNPESYPVKGPKKIKQTRRGVAFWMVRRDGAVLLRRRPEKGLLGGMMEVPSTEWRDAAWSVAEATVQAPADGPWRPLPGVVRHTFTHFHLELMVLAADIDGAGVARVAEVARVNWVWSPPDGFSAHALPSVMKKIVRHALSHEMAPGHEIIE